MLRSHCSAFVEPLPCRQCLRYRLLPPTPPSEAPTEDPTEETDLWVPTHQEPVIDRNVPVDLVPDEPSSFEFSVEPAPPTPIEDAGLVFLNRERFTDELQLYFDDYETSGSSFAPRRHAN